MNETLYTLLVKYLRKSNILISKEELKFQLLSHPSYPSLHAITGVLEHISIENVELHVPVNKETLVQLPNTFLAQINMDGGKELVIAVNDKLHYTVITSTEKFRLTLTEFIERFTGVLVAVEKTESQFETKDKNTWLPNSLLIITGFLFIGLFFLSQPTIAITIYFMLTLLGIYISLAIIKQGQGIQTNIGNAFCTGNNEKKDCDAVINSKGAMLVGLLKLSDLSLVYFLGLAIATYLLVFQNTGLLYLYSISVIAFPITIYSIYYQYAVVKKWCMFCLGIVAILWAQMVIVLLEINTLMTFSFSMSTLVIIGFGFLIALTIWIFLAPNLEMLIELKKSKIEYFKFKRNFSLFQTLLSKQKTIDTTISDTSEIVFGNKLANLQLTIITNPFCRHCKEVHTLLEDILKKYKNQVRITVRFNVNTNDLENEIVKITSRLLEVYHTKDIDSCLKAMHEIYKEQNAFNWLKKWEECYEPQQYIEILKKENRWCKATNINFTPEILINGKPFPKEYDKNDLLFFIEDLDKNLEYNEAYDLEFQLIT
jgi:uncharacterized membrane protein